MSTSEVELDSLATTVHWYIYMKHSTIFPLMIPSVISIPFDLSWNNSKLTMGEDQKMAVLDKSYKV